jgi:hypothetical protein
MIQSNIVRRVMRGCGASAGGTEDRAKVEPLAANWVQPIFDVGEFLLGTVIIGATLFAGDFLACKQPCATRGGA